MKTNADLPMDGLGKRLMQLGEGVARDTHSRASHGQVKLQSTESIRVGW